MNKAHYKNYKQVELPSCDILKERFAERFSAYEPVKDFPLLLLTFAIYIQNTNLIGVILH